MPSVACDRLSACGRGATADPYTDRNKGTDDRSKGTNYRNKGANYRNKGTNYRNKGLSAAALRGMFNPEQWPTHFMPDQWKHKG
jgi:hypothetical protein